VDIAWADRQLSRLSDGEIERRDAQGVTRVGSIGAQQRTANPDIFAVRGTGAGGRSAASP